MQIQVHRYDFWKEWTTQKRCRMTKHNKNWLAVTVGGTGDGKSWGTGRVCECVDNDQITGFTAAIKEYGIETRVALGKANRFIKMINEGLEEKLFHRGSCIIFDEAGVGLSARDFWTQSNKAINYVLQTFRHFNIGVIFTVPDLTFIDIQARKLFHTYMEAQGVDYDKSKVKIKPFEMTNNPRMGVIYYKYPMFHGMRVKRFLVCKPSEIFIEQYEPLKIKLSKELGIEAEKQSEIEETKKQHKLVTDFDIMRDIKNNITENDAYFLQAKYGIGKDRAYRIQKNLNKYIDLVE